MPARYIRLDPLIVAHMVEVIAGRIKGVIESGVAGGVDLILQRGVDRTEVRYRLGVRVVLPEEVVQIGRSGRLGRQKVGQRQVEARGQIHDRRVLAVDQLTTPLTDLAIGPASGVGVHPPADIVLSLEDGRRIRRDLVGTVLQRERGIQARDAGPDDRDPGCGRGCRRKGLPQQHRRADRRARRTQYTGLEDLAPGEPLFAPRLLPLGLHLLYGAAGLFGRSVVAGNPLQDTQQGRTRSHCPSLTYVLLRTSYGLIKLAVSRESGLTRHSVLQP